MSYGEHEKNAYDNRSISSLDITTFYLLSTVMRRKSSWFGHACRHDMLSKIILQGTADGSCRRGRPRKPRRDDIKEWTGQLLLPLLRIADDRSRWATIALEASVGVPERRLGVMGVS